MGQIWDKIKQVATMNVTSPEFDAKVGTALKYPFTQGPRDLKNLMLSNVTSPEFDAKVGSILKYPFVKVSEGVAAIPGAMKSGLKTGGKLAIITGAAVATAYVASRVVNGMRERREYKEPPPVAPDPQAQMVVDQFAARQQAMSAAQQPTLMGMPLVEGTHVQRVKSGRGQLAAGVDASAPQLEKDGRSTVDGRPVDDMGAFVGRP